MNSYLFFLGQNSLLSQAELTSLIPEAKLTTPHQSIVKLDSPTSLDLPSLGCRLGGTVKIAVLKQTSSAKQLQDDLVKLLLDQQAKNFSLNLLDSTNQESYELSNEVKQRLVDNQLRTRFIAPTSTGISPVIITKQKAVELTIDSDFNIYQTTWVHSFKSWINRDRRKPFVTPKSGMLPPKLARIMVNLAVGDKDPGGLTLLDPFCGTGTILMEAALQGIKVTGSDLSADKVAGTKTNLDWLDENQACAPLKPATVFQANATNLKDQLVDQIDLIVTEPTLGPASPSQDKLSDIAHGLQKLYLGALKHWALFLKPQARVVIALPIFHGQNRSYTTADFIDARENLGYNTLRNDLIFTRPGAQIERQIVVLEKQ